MAPAPRFGLLGLEHIKQGGFGRYARTWGQRQGGISQGVPLLMRYRISQLNLAIPSRWQAPRRPYSEYELGK
jgi:hypothetical protein